MDLEGKASEFHIAFEATLLEARHGVVRATRHIDALNLPDSLAHAVQIAMTEAVNNVVEHAYQGRIEGDVQLWISRQGDQLTLRIEDTGRVLPKAALRPGDQHIPLIQPMDLPEGGFGWQIIRALACDIQYTRRLGRNQLTLCFDGTETAQENNS